MAKITPAEPRLKRRDRRVFSVEDLTAEQIAALEKAEVPPSQEHLDGEIKDWPA